MSKNPPPLATFRRKRLLAPWFTGSVLLAIACPAWSVARAQSAPSATWSVSIVLPARVDAGQPATLAVLGVDGKLAPGVAVEIGNGQRLTTDETGRAMFTAPASGTFLLAKSSGISTAALLDSAEQGDVHKNASVSAAVSLREPFSICGAGFQGNADLNRVKINDEPALVMAASPECLSILPGAKSQPGPAQITVQSLSGHWSAATTLVALEPEFPSSPMLPGKKGRISVHVRGSDRTLRILVSNETPGVVQFLRGDMQELTSSGGTANSVELEAEAIRSGDFLLDARLLPQPDFDAARRYLQAAQPLAPSGSGHQIKGLSDKLVRHPDDFEDVRRGIDRILAATIAGDFRTLLAAARGSL